MLYSQWQVIDPYFIKRNFVPQLMSKAAITGIHGYVPDYILTNAELERMVDTNDEWITSRTGIKDGIS